MEPDAGPAEPPMTNHARVRTSGSCAAEMMVEVELEAEPDSAEEEADFEAVPVPRPMAPTRPGPAIDAPTGRRPSSMARRVAVRN